MSEGVEVVPAGSARHRELESAGWVVTARSWAAQVDTHRMDRARLEGFLRCVAWEVRELAVGDVPAMLTLDAQTLADYPGGIATRHEPLTRETAAPSPQRRGFGAFHENTLIGMTILDRVDARAETALTVVARPWRGKGVARGLKAASVLVRAADGVLEFRTGGSAQNLAIVRANTSLGYVLDEEWVTLEPAARFGR